MGPLPRLLIGGTRFSAGALSRYTETYIPPADPGSLDRGGRSAGCMELFHRPDAQPHIGVLMTIGAVIWSVSEERGR